MIVTTSAPPRLPLTTWTRPRSEALDRVSLQDSPTVRWADVRGRAGRAARHFTPAERVRFFEGKLTARELEAAEARAVPAALPRLEHDRFNPEVLVIGAGMAGLSAAHELACQGRTVTVLEARDRVGGRVWTRDGVDLGAFWLHQSSSDPNPLVDMAQNLGLKLEHDGQLELASGGPGTPREEGEAYGATRDRLHARYQELGLQADAPLGSLPPGCERWARQAAQSLTALDLGVDAERASARDYVTMVDVDADRLLRGGMGQLTDALATGLAVDTSTPVTRVKWGAEGVEVEAGGRTYRAKKLILTPSTGALRSGKIVFDPPLPAWKTDAVEHLPMGSFDKIVLQFRENVFPDAEPTTYFYVPNGPIEFVLKPLGGNLAVGFVGGAFGRTVTEKEAVDLAMGHLRKAYGARVDQCLEKAAVTDWDADPWTLGAYSAALPGHQHQRAILARPVGPLLFAGEATEEKWAATVAGAFLSGQRAAREALR